MLKIVKIQYKSDHIRIDLDSGEKLDLDIIASSQYRLSADKDISQEEYLQLKNESARFTCYRKAISYIAVRSKTSQEVSSYLKRKGFDADVIEEAVDKLKDLKYINDLDYAERYSKQKISGKAVGKNRIKQDLMRKGISRDVIRKVISEIPDDMINFEKIYAAALKKFNSVKNKPNPMQKVYSFLISRGYNSDAASKVIQQLKKSSIPPDSEIEI